MYKLMKIDGETILVFNGETYGLVDSTDHENCVGCAFDAPEAEFFQPFCGDCDDKVFQPKFGVKLPDTDKD